MPTKKCKHHFDKIKIQVSFIYFIFTFFIMCYYYCGGNRLGAHTNIHVGPRA